MSLEPFGRSIGPPEEVAVSGPLSDLLELHRLLGNSPAPSQPLQGYRLALADGCRWWLSGLGPAAPWAERLAAIMHLLPGEVQDAAPLVFSKLPPGPPAGSFHPEAQGWEVSKQRYLRAWSRPGRPETLCAFPLSRAGVVYSCLWSSLAFIYQASMRRGGLPLHGALVAREGRGVALVASGETGKSTCCRRLPLPWRPLCDDELLVVRDPGGQYLAHPFPTWSDYLLERARHTWDVQSAVPLAAVCLLEQSPEDDILLLGRGGAAVSLYDSTLEVRYKLWLKPGQRGEPDYRRLLFDNAALLVAGLPVFRLRVSLNGRFWELIEGALGWR